MSSARAIRLSAPSKSMRRWGDTAGPLRTRASECKLTAGFQCLRAPSRVPNIWSSSSFHRVPYRCCVSRCSMSTFVVSRPCGPRRWSTTPDSSLLSRKVFTNRLAFKGCRFKGMHPTAPSERQNVEGPCLNLESVRTDQSRPHGVVFRMLRIRSKSAESASRFASPHGKSRDPLLLRHARNVLG